MTELTTQNVALYLHQQNVDGTTPAGRAMLGMAAVFAEFERSMLIVRIHAGIARARKHGTKSGNPIGRPRARTANVESRVRDLRTKGYGLVRIGRELGIGTGRCKRILAEAA